jgi:hypothetical protein
MDLKKKKENMEEENKNEKVNFSQKKIIFI